MKPLYLLAAALAAAAPAPGTPPAAPGRFQAPEVRAQGYRFVVEQVQQQQYEQTEFPPGAPEGAVGKTSGRQHLFVRLAVHPPQPGLLPHIEGLDPKVVGVAGDRSVTLRSYPVEDSGPVGGGVWRCQLSAQEVELSATRLGRLQGELIVYPKARVVTLDFPAGVKTPVSREADGFHATLRSTRIRAGNLTIAMELAWPASLSVTRPNPDSPTGVVAVTKLGSVLPPSGSSSSATDRPGWVSRTHTLTFVDVKDPPERIRVEALVRSGAAHRIKFTLPDIALPHTLGIEADPSEAEEGGPLEPGDPLYSPKGGTLAMPVRASAPGRLVLGLARLEGGAAGPWRWLDVRMEKDRAVLTSVQPGRYRVVRAWLPLADPAVEEPASLPVRLGEVLEVEVPAGQTVTLAPVEVGAAR